MYVFGYWCVVPNEQCSFFLRPFNLCCSFIPFVVFLPRLIPYSPINSELAPLTVSAAAEQPVSPQTEAELEVESEEAQEKNEEVANEQGFVVEDFEAVPVTTPAPGAVVATFPPSVTGGTNATDAPVVATEATSEPTPAVVAVTTPEPTVAA